MRTTSWTTWRPLLLLSLGFLLSSISAKDGDTEASTKETKITPAPTTVAAGVDPTTATTATPAVASTSQAVVGSGPGATHTLAPSVNPDITTKASANVTLIALAPTTAKPTPPAVPSQSQTTQILVKMTPAPAIIQTTVPTAISPAIPSKPSTVVPASTAGKGATVVVSHHSETVTTPYPATPASTSGTSKTEASTTTVTKNIGTTQTPKVPTAAPLPTVKPSANTLSTTRASQGVTDRTTMIASQGQTTPGSTQPPVSIIVSGVPGVPSTTTPPTTTIAGTSTAATLTIKAGVASGKPTTSITSLRSTPTSGVSKAITVRSTKTETQTLPDLAKKRFEYSLNKGQETEEDKTLVEICRRLLANMRDGKCTMTYEHRDGKLDFDMVEINGKVPDTLVEEYYEELNKKPTDNKTLIAILASCGALLIMIVILAVCASHHRKPYSENQQHLTEELPTVENGYHDNPTLDVMEAQPDMQEKKPALNGEFNDSWIVPLENMMKGDVPDEEDTHL